MNVEIQVNNHAAPSSNFVGWTPAPCRIRVSTPSGVATPTVNVVLSSTSAASGGKVVFRSSASGASATTLSLTLPTSGSSVNFFCCGTQASTNPGDVSVQAKSGATIVGSVAVMVRIRKNANTLTSSERDRFVNAFAALNNQGLGRFSDFREMHTNVTSPQAHGAPGFLPWHRAYILDLERELQAIDSSVALPYWRFDQPSPNIFTPEFLGVSNALGSVSFAASNPLQFWKTDGVLGISRRPLFNTATGSASVINQASTLALGGSSAQYSSFRSMEGNPHGSAHVSFGGSISSIGTATRDPLFFLLHCNVDRLWAVWQKKFARFDANLAASFDSSSSNVGHRLNDTMWPWNGITTPPRPPTAPGGTLASSTIVSAPSSSPTVRSMIDYQGFINSASRIGFDYDDVPF